MRKGILGLALWVGISGVGANANEREEAPLDPAPKVVVGVKENDLFRFDSVLRDLVLSSNNLTEALDRQTPVKSQGHRGTCSIFSATGALESLLKIETGNERDLSENYLEYLVMTKMKSFASEGSDTNLNIPAFARFGTVTEATWPYEEYDWTSTDIPSEEITKAEETCGNLEGNSKQACLLGHMSPELDRFSRQAMRFRTQNGLANLTYNVLDRAASIKQELNQNNPLILSVEFFYGAWNHRKMVEYGIGERDMSAWGRGEVSTPTTQDVRLSRNHPAGHSIVVVGYDDAKRVYYFKNSWGTSSFGVDSDLLGGGSTAGYGSISYDYAHRYGTFYSVTK